jgi:hypothetical protein
MDNFFSVSGQQNLPAPSSSTTTATIFFSCALLTDDE